MLTKLRTRLQNEDEGFTLIELMVVVLIIAILIAIAIPTFLGAQDRARDRGAQSDLRNALTAAKTIATDDAGRFDNVNVGTLTSAEGALTFATTVDPAEGVVSVTVIDDDNLILDTVSASGQAFAVCANSDGTIEYAKADADAMGDCTLPKW